MPAKKTSSKSGTKKSAPNKVINKAELPKNKNHSFERSMGMKITPYVFCALAVLLAVCFILVAFDGSAGVLGEGLFSFFGALFGLGAYALPVVFGYIGVRWCVFNLRWNESTVNNDGEKHADYVSAKRRMTVVAVMSALTILFISAFIGVIADQRDFDLASFWSDGWDGEAAEFWAEVLRHCFYCLIRYLQL